MPQAREFCVALAAALKKNRCKSLDSVRESDESDLERDCQGKIKERGTQFIHVNYRCQKKEELSMEDRRSSRATELRQGISSLVILTAGIVVYQNRAT